MSDDATRRTDEPRTAAATPASEAYVQGHIDRYRRDREEDVLCRNCGKPWAIEAEAARSAGPTEHMRQSTNGCVTCSRRWSEHTAAEKGRAAASEPLDDE